MSEEDFHKTWMHRWLSEKTAVRPSPICARGLFAISPIKKGEIIRVTGGIIVPKSEAEKYNDLIDYDVKEVYLDISDEFLMAPTQGDLETTATINHSCEPNAGFLDTITIVSMRDIGAGEEITWDYAFSQTTFESFECRCKTSDCRKLITPNDWQIKSIQNEYLDYYSPYLKAKIINLG